MRIISILFLLVFVNACSSGGNPFFVPGSTCQKDIEVKADLPDKNQKASQLKKTNIDVTTLPAGDYVYNGATIYYEGTYQGSRSVIKVDDVVLNDEQKAAKEKRKKSGTDKSTDDERKLASCVYNTDISKGFIYSITGVSSIKIQNDKSSTINTKLYTLKFGTDGVARKDTDKFEFIPTQISDTNVPGAPKDSYDKAASVHMYKSEDPQKVDHFEIRAMQNFGTHKLLVITRFIRK